jgi:hypothetical protein
LLKLRQGLLRHAGGDRVMAQVLAAVPTAGLAAVLVAVELVVESGVLSAEHVENVLARLNAGPVLDFVETRLKLKEAPVANTSRYDTLRAGAGEYDVMEAGGSGHAQHRLHIASFRYCERTSGSAIRFPGPFSPIPSSRSHP